MQPDARICPPRGESARLAILFQVPHVWCDLRMDCDMVRRGVIPGGKSCAIAQKLRELYWMTKELSVPYYFFTIAGRLARTPSRYPGRA